MQKTHAKKDAARKRITEGEKKPVCSPNPEFNWENTARNTRHKYQPYSNQL
jgi:hypothetical protein